MNLQIDADRAQHTLTVVLSGTLDRLTTRELPDALKAWDAATFETVILDLSDCVITHPVVIDTLVRANRSMNAVGTRLQLIGARPALHAPCDHRRDDSVDRLMTAS